MKCDLNLKRYFLFYTTEYQYTCTMYIYKYAHVILSFHELCIVQLEFFLQIEGWERSMCNFRSSPDLPCSKRYHRGNLSGLPQKDRTHVLQGMCKFINMKILVWITNKRHSSMCNIECAWTRKWNIFKIWW